MAETPEQLEALIEAHFDALYRFFASKLSQPSDIEDLVQRTLLDCAESMADRNVKNRRAYLFGIARNRLMDHLRERHRHPIEQLMTMSIADLGTSPSQAVARDQERALVVQAMTTLPLELQMTLELRYWEQMSDDEIAEALDISANTVRSRLSRGRGRLREILGIKFEPPTPS